MSIGSRMLIDGIVIPPLSLSSLRDMRLGGLTAGVYISSIWEGQQAAFENLAYARKVISASEDALLVRTVNDVLAAHDQNKLGMILGWKNSDGFNGNPDTVKLFQEVGLRLASICFNYANASASGCLESHDGGLTSLGRDIIQACNDAGIVLDIAHASNRSEAEALAISTKPLCYTHAVPLSIYEHRRNKTDAQLKAIANSGGVIGVSSLAKCLGPPGVAALSHYAEAVRHVLNVAGEDHVAMGTDLTPGQPAVFYTTNAARNGVRDLQDPIGEPQLPGLSAFSEYESAIARLGNVMTPRQLDKFCSANWLRLFKEVWY